MSKGWTEERRKKQAERCRQNKPWEKATGPKTEAGKARTRMNAFRHGGRSKILKLEKQALAYNGKFLELLNAAINLEQIEMKNLQKKQRRSDWRFKKIDNELKDFSDERWL